MLNLSKKTKENIIIAVGAVVIVLLMYLTGTCNIFYNADSATVSINGFLTAGQTVAVDTVTDARLLDAFDGEQLSGTGTLRCRCGDFDYNGTAVRGYFCGGKKCLVLYHADGITLLSFENDQKTELLYQAIMQSLQK